MQRWSERVREDDGLGSWLRLVAGLLLAPIFLTFPLLSYMGWFVRSLVHEMGHCTAAWLVGSPAFPVISLAGEAMTAHLDVVPALTFLVYAGLIFAAVRFFEGNTRIAAVVVVVVLHPLLAWTPLRPLLHLMGGHLAELSFAGLCLWRAWRPCLTGQPGERLLYATLGWLFVWHNLALFAGMIFSPTARSEYRINGSFGLEGDLDRVAAQLGLAVEVVCIPLLLLTVVVALAALVPLALGYSPSTLKSEASAGNLK